MSIGKIKRKTTSYKNQQRDKTAAEEQASMDALAREQALALEVEDNLKRNKNLILASIAVVVIGGGIYATQESRQALRHPASGAWTHLCTPLRSSRSSGATGLVRRF